MKKSLLLGILSVMFAASVMAQQQLPNGSLEDWTYNELLEFWNPVDWQTPNLATAITQTFTTTRSDDASAGSYSARLESKNVSGFLAPGVLTLGNFTVDFINNTAYLTGGIAFTDKPIALNGSWKNYPVTGDFTMIIIYFTKYSTTKGQADTIGIGTMIGSATVDTWTDFNIPIEYFGTEDPDTMNLHVVSSNMLNLQEGSIMFVDNLALEYEAGINDIDENISSNVFPNPASDRLSFSFEKEVKAELKVFSNDGQMVYTSSVNGLDHHVDVSGLASGTYYYGLFEKSKKISSGQFVISR